MEYIRRGKILFSILILLIIVGGTSSIGKNENIGNIIKGKENIPIENFIQITSKYGFRDDPIMQKRIFHGGIDFAAKPGTKLISIVDGKIIFSSFKGPYGYSILIDSGEGYIIHYAHCDPQNMPKLGKKVVKGEIIGMVGPKYVKDGPLRDEKGRFVNGFTTGPHLHFGILQNKKYIDPRKIIGNVY